MTDSLNIGNTQFAALTDQEALEIVGGWSWDEFADFMGGVCVVSAVSPAPGARGVTVVCGTYYCVYKLVKAIRN